MNSRFRCAWLILFLACCLESCNLPRLAPSPEDAAVGTSVAKTMQSLTRPVPPTQPALPTQLVLPTQTDFPTQIPSLTPPPSPTTISSATSQPKPGSLAGGIYGYPYGSVPSLTFVAFSQTSSQYWYWIIPPGAISYLTNPFITPGKYRVVVYDGSGHRGGCTTIVTVISDQTATCDITDWAGSYPSKPSGVP